MQIKILASASIPRAVWHPPFPRTNGRRSGFIFWRRYSACSWPQRFLLLDTHSTRFRARSCATHLLNDVFIAAFNLWPKKADDFYDGYGCLHSG